MNRCPLLLFTLALGAVSARDAKACVVLAPPAVPVPSVQLEESLLIHDPARGMEHFVRQITFHKGTTPFGFVVPVPSRPEVASVAHAPFESLKQDYPLVAPPRADDSFFPSRSKGGEVAAAAAAPPPQVAVLSQEKLGSFTAFVLEATDASGLTAWLDENHFATPPGTVAWLAHYTALHFYYAAFRFDPGAAADGPALSSETMRISFAAGPGGLPYYPYSEPQGPLEPQRVLAVWLVSPRAMTPAAARSDAAGNVGARWERPWKEGVDRSSPPDVLGSALGPDLAPLLPAATDGGQLQVQPFEDQKRSRRGWGDVVLVPRAPVSPATPKPETLAAVLDPKAVLP
jgi:hypothetical protein